ncbi:MAG: type 4a pilus biogenesis protein PilO [Bryobacterales bacterium]
MTNNSSAANRSSSRQLSKQTVIGALVVLAALELAFWFFLVRPLSNREAEQQALTANLVEQVTAKRDSVERLRDAKAKVDAAAAAGDELLAELTFEHQTTFSELLTEIGAAAKEAGVEVRETNYESDTIEGNDKYGMVTISANFRGSYESLVKLLHRLDRSPKFLIVERLGAAPRDDGQLAISMRIDAFVRDL